MNSQFRRPLTKCLALLICLELSTQVLAQTGDGGGAAGVQPGEIGAAPGPASAGAQGTDAGSVNLSRGATIAICVVVSVVVILGGKFSPVHSKIRAMLINDARDSCHDSSILHRKETAMDHERNHPAIGQESRQHHQSRHDAHHAQEDDIFARGEETTQSTERSIPQEGERRALQVKIERRREGKGQS